MFGKLDLRSTLGSDVPDYLSYYSLPDRPEGQPGGLADIASTSSLGNNTLDIMQIIGLSVNSSVTEVNFKAAYDKACIAQENLITSLGKEGKYKEALEAQQNLEALRREYHYQYMGFRHTLNSHGKAMTLINRRRDDYRARPDSKWSVVDVLADLIHDIDLRATLAVILAMAFKSATVIASVPQSQQCPNCFYTTGHSDSCRFNQDGQSGGAGDKRPFP